MVRRRLRSNMSNILNALDRRINVEAELAAKPCAEEGLDGTMHQ